MTVAVLEIGDLVQAARVAPAFELGVQPNVDDALDQFLADQVGR